MGWSLGERRVNSGVKLSRMIMFCCEVPVFFLLNHVVGWYGAVPNPRRTGSTSPASPAGVWRARQSGVLWLGLCTCIGKYSVLRYAYTGVSV